MHTQHLCGSRLEGRTDWEVSLSFECSVKFCLFEFGRYGDKEEEEEAGLSAAGFHHSWQPLLSFHGNAKQCSLLLFCPPSLYSCFLSLTPSLLPIFIAGRPPPYVSTAML
ncbi:hypothetical protein ILYODFUR_014238 [Ilyodon furcidens]|uniref:Uncharacterized protein n=1 Tax=Ilyodon furcidens TaxID=33524 RepID=A0ABV0SL40_9TELE